MKSNIYILLFVTTLIFNGCKKDDDNNIEEEIINEEELILNNHIEVTESNDYEITTITESNDDSGVVEGTYSIQTTDNEEEITVVMLL